MQDLVDADWVYRRYEVVRERFPPARHPEHAVEVQGLLDLIDRFDAFVFDSFGVLNVGDRPIADAPACIAALRAAGKRVLVLTNASGVPARDYAKKLEGFGYDFAMPEIVSSRELLLSGLNDQPKARTWACIAAPNDPLNDLPPSCMRYDADIPGAADGIIFLGVAGWTHDQNTRLIEDLKRRPRPVLVGNPDLAAPREDGYSIQPGSFTHDIADATGITPVFYGKPFGNAFDEVKARLEGIAPEKVLMLGDTLHTDILGAASAGLKAGLVTGFGMLKDMDISACIAESGIVPDYMMPSIG